MSDSFVHLAIAMVGLMYIIKALHKSAPNVTGAAKTAAANKAVSVISKWLK